MSSLRSRMRPADPVAGIGRAQAWVARDQSERAKRFCFHMISSRLIAKCVHAPRRTICAARIAMPGSFESKAAFNTSRALR